MSRQVAEMLGARHESLDGVGHWWTLQAPEVATPVLKEFLESVN